ncbi:hypothetical protein EDC96DRAFT_582298 [Choanephora cucurbitarum]|nr:hypothetical protein EDC96DRAFT_582298 [Choanephora cucurbitarum]
MTNIGRAAVIPSLPPTIVEKELGDLLPIPDNTNIPSLPLEPVPLELPATSIVDQAIDHVDPVVSSTSNDQPPLVVPSVPDNVPFVPSLDLPDPIDLSAVNSSTPSRLPNPSTVEPSVDANYSDSDAVVDILVDNSPNHNNSTPFTPLADCVHDDVDTSLLDSHSGLDDFDQFEDAHENIPVDMLSDHSSEADYNFDVDIDEAAKSPILSPTPVLVDSAPSSPRSSHVQRRTSSQEGGNVTNTSTDKRKQPIEVEYNLPHLYNPNKRRFKPQILNKRRKKIKLNSLRIRKLPLAKVSSLLHSSRHKDQSS